MVCPNHKYHKSPNLWYAQTVNTINPLFAICSGLRQKGTKQILCPTMNGWMLIFLRNLSFNAATCYTFFFLSGVVLLLLFSPLGCICVALLAFTCCCLRVAVKQKQAQQNANSGCPRQPVRATFLIFDIFVSGGGPTQI